MRVVYYVTCWLLTNFSVAQSQFRRITSSSHCFFPSNSLGTKYVTKNSIICAFYSNRLASDYFSWDAGICELFSDGITDDSVGSVFAKNLSTSTFKLVEVGAKKPTLASPPYEQYVSSFVNDGDWNTVYHSTDDTAHLQPYIVIDLQGQLLVSKIRILPSIYSVIHVKRFIDVQVLVGNTAPTGNFSSYDVVHTYQGPFPIGTYWMEIIVDPPVCGRYVGLYKYIEHPDDKYFLAVYELEVYANVDV